MGGEQPTVRVFRGVPRASPKACYNSAMPSPFQAWTPALEPHWLDVHGDRGMVAEARPDS